MSRSDSHVFATDVLKVAADLAAAGRAFVLAVVTEAQGSTSARPGAKAIIDSEGTVVTGWVGGGCAESAVAHAAIECLETQTPQIIEIDLDDEVLGAGMPCGGRMKVYVEPVMPRPTLWILGHGQIAEYLCRLGALMDFDVVVKESMASPARYPDALRVIGDDIDSETMTPDASDFVVIATQHRGDHESLRSFLKTDVGYIGLIASRKRAGLVMDYLRATGIPQSDIDRIRAPAGIEIQARTASEIALSVISEIVLVRRNGVARRAELTDKLAAGEKRPAIPLSIQSRPHATALPRVGRDPKQSFG